MHLFLAILLGVSFGVIQALIGGAKLVYSLPAYAFVGLVGLIAAFVPWGRGGATPRILCVASTLALAVYVCVRSMLSPVEYLARPDLFMAIGALVVYLVAASHLTRPQERLTILWILLGFAVVHVAVGAVQFKENTDYMLLSWIFRPPYGRRASGFYICPNHLAGLLEMLGLIALSLCCWGRMKAWARAILGYGAVMCLCGVAITGSRGGYLSTLFGLLAFAALTLWVVRQVHPKRFLPALLLSAAVGMVIVGGAIFLMMKSASLQERLGTVYEPENMRRLLWAAALKQFALNPATGTGSGTYVYYGREFRSHVIQNDPIHVHSDYLELLAEYGVAGAALLTIFLGLHLFSGVRGLRDIVKKKLKPERRSTSNELAILLGVLAATAALMAHSAIDFNLHIPANMLFVAFLFGILALPSVDPTVNPRVFRPRWRWLRLAAPLTGTTLLVLAIPLIAGEYFGERARIALRDRQHPEARALALRGLEHERKNPDLYYYYGEAQHYLALETAAPSERRELFENAAAAFGQGLRLFPQDLNLLMKLGRTLDNLGRFDDAAQFYERALAADPHFGNVHAYYGLHFHLQRRFKMAERFYRKAHELGEIQVSNAGLKDLERDRALAKDDVFGDLISHPEMEEDDE